jgi:hypothetical protein
VNANCDVVIVGAGIAGTAAARTLTDAGARVVVLERARGVGGRCAVRRIDGRPVDFGLPFLHGRDPDFLAAVAAAPATRIEPWPRLREGAGLPCRPEAFAGEDRVLAYREGVNALPRHLALGLDVRAGTEVTAVGCAGDRLAATTAAGAWLAPAVVMTAPIPHAWPPLAALAAAEPVLAGWKPALDQVRYLPCLALIAEYPPGTPPPGWDISLPRIAAAVHSIVNDSSKREPGAAPVLVLQAGIAYSRAHLGRPEPEWAPPLLAEAARLHGAWIARPLRRTPHVWEHARVQPPTELAHPAVLTLSNGACLALCGDAFSPAGGAEGAFASGRAAARAVLRHLDPSHRPHPGEPSVHPIA